MDRQLLLSPSHLCMTPPHGVPALPSPHTHPTPCTGAYVPVYLASRDKLAGGTGRSLTFVLGNMLSAGGCGGALSGCLAASLLLLRCSVG